MSSSSNDNKPAGRIRTLSDLNRPSEPGSDCDCDPPHEHYTGGEKSGMLVQDPSKDNEVDAIFERARGLGAVQGPPEIPPTSPSTSRPFSGTGRLPSGEIVPSDPTLQQPDSIVHNIIFYRNGFTVNDGPLRRTDDPENASFLESLKKTECPKELEPVDKRSPVCVNLTKTKKICPEPKIVKSPFEGVGRTLGSSSSTSEASEPMIAEPLDTSPAPTTGCVIDESLPSTAIQLRLSDGTRMVAHFNYHHSIADIRSFIDASRTGAARTYQLQTVGFPPKVLNDPTETIEQAGLASSVIIQNSDH